MADVRVKGSQMVKPAESTFNGVVPLTMIDQIKSFNYIQLVYFYKPTSSSNELRQQEFSLVSSTLRDSLAPTLVYFYPFAGRIVYCQLQTTNNYSFDCNDVSYLELRCGGEGAVFMEAESSDDLADFAGDFFDLSKLKNIIPWIDKYDWSPKMLHKIPLLLVQLTTFSCGGYSVGILMSHGVVDGLSGTHFLKEWSRIARCESLKTAPFMDRPVLGARGRPKELQPLPAQASESDERTDLSKQLRDVSSIKDKVNISRRRGKLTRVMLPLSKNRVEKLMYLVATAANNFARIFNDTPDNSHRRPYTPFEVITAYLWRCFSETMGHDDKSEVPMGLTIAVDVRGRIQPPLPSQYFGNALSLIAATSQAGRIISHPLVFTCEKLRQMMDRVNDEYIRSRIKLLRFQRTIEERRASFASSETFTMGAVGSMMDLYVVNWLTLPLYGLDFGWGKEICMRSGPRGHLGEIFVMKGQPNDEPGQVHLIVSLREDQLERFKKHLYEDDINMQKEDLPWSRM